MGGSCSRSSVPQKKNLYAGRVDYYGSNGAPHGLNEMQWNNQGILTSTQVTESVDEKSQQSMQQNQPISIRERGTSKYWSSEDDFYDGIPRIPKSLQKSRSTKVSEVSSRLGRASSVGLGKAVEVLDTLGSSLTSLNPSGFIFDATSKGNELSILAFEVANTIVKGSSLLQSLSKRSIRLLKEVVLSSEGVQHLVSKDTDELLQIVATDKREELKIFAGEVVRFGNHCKGSQWHNLDIYFEKHDRQLVAHGLSKEEAESMMQQLMTLVQYTADLYQELHALERLEQGYQHKHLEVAISNAAQRVAGKSLAILKSELKSQRKLVTNLKKKSLWSRNLEEVMERLVDIVLFLNREIHNTFGSSVSDIKHPSIGSLGNQSRLGSYGLALHYANIIIQIDTIVARSNSMAPNLRDTLYQSLPPSIKSSLRSKLHSFRVSEELTVSEIKTEMEKTLHWLVPVAINTAKAHHGFGWVGEWANAGSEVNRKQTGLGEVIQIETLHYADKEKTEAYILELVLWLNHLICKSRVGANVGGMMLKTNQQPVETATNTPSSMPSTEEQAMPQDVINKKKTRGLSKSQDFDSMKKPLRKHERLSKSSSSQSPTTESKELVPVKSPGSSIPAIDFGLDKEKVLDVISRVEIQA